MGQNERHRQQSTVASLIAWHGTALGQLHATEIQLLMPKSVSYFQACYTCNIRFLSISSFTISISVYVFK